MVFLNYYYFVYIYSKVKNIINFIFKIIMKKNDFFFIYINVKCIVLLEFYFNFIG